MTWQKFAMLFLMVTVVSLGQVLFKLAANSMQPGAPFWMGFLNPAAFTAMFLYGACALLWINLLRGVELSTSYPVLSLSFVLVPVFSWLAFNESVSWLNVAGYGLIAMGITLATR